MMAIVSVFPLGKGGPESLAKPIADALDEIDKSGLEYRLTAMGTIIEGEWDEVMKVLKRVRDRILKHHERAYMTISIDDKKDRLRRIDSKVKAVEHELGRKLRH